MYDEEGDESVNALQDKLIAMTGMEAALWTASGTMGNQICLRTHLQQPPHAVLVDYRAHVHCWECGALAVFSQATSTCAHPRNGVHLTLEDVKKRIIPDGNSKMTSQNGRADSNEFIKFTSPQRGLFPWKIHSMGLSCR